MAIKKRSSVPAPNQSYLRPLIMFGLMLVTWLVYYPILSNGFINWDDPSLILENPAIRSLQFSSIRHLFTSWFLGNYHPLTMLSFSIEYAFFGTSPKGYHMVSLLLHILNTMLVFLLFSRIMSRKILAPTIIAVFFAIHPMHLESIAWATEQKDILYSFFFLGSLLLYVVYREDRNKKKFLMFSAMAFLFSLLSKPQAVTLPLVLILIDYLFEKRFSWTSIREKIPFLFLSLVFGTIAIIGQHQSAGINEAKVPPVDFVFMNSWAYFTYLIKAVLPVNLSGHHEYPYQLNGSLPVYIYLSPVAVLVIFFLIYRYMRSHIPFVFGFLFFTLSLLPMLMLPVGNGYMEERFSYIAYLGLFFIIASFTVDVSNNGRSKSHKNILIIVCIVFAFLFAIRTHFRTAIWKDSLTYWNDVSDSYPHSLLACEHKAMYHYYEADDIPAAIADLRYALEFDSTYATGYRLSGYFYLLGGDPETADSLLTIGLRLDPHNSDIYIYRGETRKALKQYRQAVEDYSHAISIDPLATKPWNDRGIIYGNNLNLPDSAIRDFTRAIRLDPANPQFYNNIAVAHYIKGKFDVAIRFADTAILKGYPAGHLIKSMSYYRKGDFPMAAVEARLTRAAGISIPDSLLYAK